MTSTIYKICSTKGDKVYIGSTKKKYLCNRKADHLSKYRLHKGRHCASYDLFDEYGVDNCSFVLLEECPLEQQLIRERWWIENTPYVVNIMRPIISEEERVKNHADAHQRRKVNRSEEDKERLAGHCRKYGKKTVQCECGEFSTQGHLARHRSSETHKKLMNDSSNSITLLTEPM
jgi:group I intron endonuclease